MSAAPPPSLRSRGKLSGAPGRQRWHLQLLSLLALGAFAAAVIAWYRAEAATQRAKMAKQRADELISYMQYDLSETLGKLGRLDMMEAINAHILQYHEDHPPETGDSDAGCAEGSAVALIGHGDVHARSGPTWLARSRAYRDSLGIREKLAKQDPDNTDWQRDLSVSYGKVGDVERAQGDLAGALKSYRDSLGIAGEADQAGPRQCGLAARSLR